MATKVVVSPNPIKTKERMDVNGNVINPVTKQIIVPKQEEYVVPPPPTTPPEAKICPVTVVETKDDPMAIQAQIEQAEANLIKLKEAKKAKIAEMEEVLNKLKQ